MAPQKQINHCLNFRVAIKMEFVLLKSGKENTKQNQKKLCLWMAFGNGLVILCF